MGFFNGCCCQPVCHLTEILYAHTYEGPVGRLVVIGTGSRIPPPWAVVSNSILGAISHLPSLSLVYRLKMGSPNVWNASFEHPRWQVLVKLL